MATEVCVQLPAATEAKVRTIAASERRSLAETLTLLAEEALKTREFPDIVFTNGPTGRRATLLGGPDVWEVVEPYVLAGKDWQVLRDSYPDLDEALLRIAVRYYEAYPKEIEVRIERNNRP